MNENNSIEEYKEQLNVEKDLVVDEKPLNDNYTNNLPNQPTTKSNSYVEEYVDTIHKKILDKADEKINDEKVIDKHAEQIAKIKERKLEVDTEKASITVDRQAAENKVKKQEINNKLIVLNAEARRLQREQKQLDKEQKADHKKRNKNLKWEIYKDKLEKMHYSYVPNVFILSMLLFFDGLKSFFDGLGSVSTAIVKCFKWVIFLGIIIAILFIIPVTRNWLLNLIK